MIFVGDIAFPFTRPPTVDFLPWNDEAVVANLEGDVVSSSEASLQDHIIFNSMTAVDFLDDLGGRAVSLANNHILDVHSSPSPTIQSLRERGISTCGAGHTLAHAQKPAIFEADESKVVLLGFGWEVIDCQAATSNRSGVNPLRPRTVQQCIERVQSAHPEAILVLFMHWNYEFELYPQPMHRQLAFRAVEAGADAVIGTHSHRVQGIEVYRGAPIVHGLGNWLFVQGEYFRGTLTYPDCASTELAFEWNPVQESMICHWFEYNSRNHTLCHQNSEPVGQSVRVQELTPYAGMDHDQYVSFFRKNRRKRRLLPVYSSCDQPISNALRNYWVALRGGIIRLLTSAGLKGPGRSS